MQTITNYKRHANQDDSEASPHRIQKSQHQNVYKQKILE